MLKTRPILWSATPTPFLPNGSLDEESIANLVEQHLRLGIDGIFACGSCGEGPWMPTAQRRRMVAALKRIAGDRISIAAQVTDASAARVKENMRPMADAGADSLVIAPPTIARFAAPDFLRRYYLEPIESSPLPVGLYALAPPIAPPVSPDLWQEMASHPKVAYVKDSSLLDEYAHAFLDVKAKRPGLMLLTGNEFDIVSAAADGYDGALAGTGILVGGMLRRALDAVEARDRAAADDWQRRSNECLWGIFGRDISRWLGGLKYALERLGIFRSDYMHLDCFPLTEDDRKEIDATIEEFRADIFPDVAWPPPAEEPGVAWPSRPLGGTEEPRNDT